MPPLRESAMPKWVVFADATWWNHFGDGEFSEDDVAGLNEDLSDLLASNWSVAEPTGSRAPGVYEKRGRGLWPTNDLLHDHRQAVLHADDLCRAVLAARRIIRELRS